jgi:DNA-damage-inducible protein J
MPCNVALWSLIMAKTGYLNARIDPSLKNKAEKILSEVGVSASQAITMFYRQVILRRGIPFEVCIPNDETVAALKGADAGGGDVIANSTQAAFDEIIGKDHDRRR